MNPFDVSILSFFNGFTRRSEAFDSLIVAMTFIELLKGGILVALFWWAWFRSGEGSAQNREYILSTFLGCFVALFVVRVLTLTLPFRSRPLYNPELHLQLPAPLYPQPPHLE